MQNSHYHIFALPTDLLDSLTARSLFDQQTVSEPPPDPVISTSKSGPRACNVCQGIVFLDLDEQRTHFRSDWHRYNVKARLDGRKAVGEADFGKLLEGMSAHF